MARRQHPWQRKEWLELNQWSLLKSVGLSRRGGYLALVLWAVAFTLSFLLHEPRQWNILGIGFMGVVPLYYIVQRLQGVPAEWLGSGASVSEEWPFQLRLVVDAIALILFLFCTAAVVVGLPVMRGALES